MSYSPGIDDVARYWDAHPVHSVEFPVNGDPAAYFDRIDRIRWEENERWAEKTFYDLPGAAGSRLLDAGCGIGVFTRYYARRGFDVHAMDIAGQALELTRQSLKLYGLKAQVLRGSVEQIPYQDNFFDYIVSNGVIHHTPDTEKAVAEFYRVLKPGGTASVCVYYRNMFLRQPLWPVVRPLFQAVLVRMKGREKVFQVKTPEDLVRVYDGNNTPIARVYSRQEADALFGLFEILRREPHYFPSRFVRFVRQGGMVHRLLDHYAGVLIYYLLKKRCSC